MLDIRKRKTSEPKEKPDEKNLGFGKYYTDHMFMMEYDKGAGWHDPVIVPYGPIVMDPACMVLHYAQETFEGLKAYRAADGRILLFRPEMNARRMMNSNHRLCMPEIPEEDFIQAVCELVETDRAWVPSEPETSLYIRPFTFASEVGVGVHPAVSYQFIVILSPVGAYYAEGMNPVRILVEDQYVRAAQGMSACKAGGNYAASILAQHEAAEKGYSQVLWLDSVERKYVEEVGTMNVMFKIDGKIVTPPIETGGILPGVTRDSCIHILKNWGYTVEERKLSIDELMDAARSGALEEAFGTGTAAVISPIGELNYKGESATVSGFKTGALTQKLYDTLTGIQWGRLPDEFGWTRAI